jgi:hypothetical protein
MSEKTENIRPGSRTDWFVHEVNNALLPIVVLRQESFDVDPADGQKILKEFLKNVKRKDLVWSSQGPLKDDDMINFAKELLKVPWIPRYFDAIIEMRDQLFDRIEEAI